MRIFPPSCFYAGGSLSNPATAAASTLIRPAKLYGEGFDGLPSRGGSGDVVGKGCLHRPGWGGEKASLPTILPSPTGRSTPFLISTLIRADSSRPPPQGSSFQSFGFQA